MPVDDPHRQPDAQRSEGDGQAWQDNAHVTILPALS
jgi:hypothetical protein